MALKLSTSAKIIVELLRQVQTEANRAKRIVEELTSERY